MKNIHQHTFKSTVLSGFTMLSLVGIPLAWRIPNLIPLVVAGGFTSSAIYYKRVGYIPSKLEKQFIETAKELEEKEKLLKADRQNLETEKTNLNNNFEKWRSEELARIEKFRQERLNDAESIIKAKLDQIDQLSQSKLKETDELIASRVRELDRRSEDLSQRETAIEEKAFELATQIKQAEQESLHRLELIERGKQEELTARANELELYRQQLDADREVLLQEREQLLKDVEALERQWQQKWLDQEERHQDEYKQLEVVYESIAGGYARENLALKQPDLFEPPKGELERIANSVMQVLGEHNIFAKNPHLEDDDRGFKLTFRVLRLKLKLGKQEIEEHTLTAGEAYKLIQGKLLPDLVAEVPNCLQAAVRPIYHGVEIYFDTTGVNWKNYNPSSPDTVHDSGKTIFDLFASTYHLGLEGSTGRGKTTTTKNILRAMKQELGENNVVIKVAAGKPDEGLREFDAVVSPEKVLLRLKEAADLVDERLNIHVVDWDANRPLTIFDQKFIYFFDEISDAATWANSNDPEVQQFLVDNDFPLDKDDKPVKNVVGILLNRCWRLGRSLGIMILVAGQNLNPSIFGLQLKDMENMGMIYVGTGAKRGIEIRGLPSEKNYYRKQYSLRIKEGQEFFAFFCSGSGDCWFDELPEHGWVKESVFYEGAMDTQVGGEGDKSSGIALAERPESGDIENLKASLSKALQSNHSTNSPPGHFIPPGIPCLVEGAITRVERDWVKWLWFVQNVRNKKHITSEVYGIKSHKHRNWQKAQERLKIINEQEGLGLSWKE